jgi:hypothetical protein
MHYTTLLTAKVLAILFCGKGREEVSWRRRGEAN